MNVLLGITGGIAAYKACNIISGLKAREHEVQVVMTKAAQKFITPLTLATLSECPVMTTMWSDWDTSGHPTVEHIEIAKWTDVFVVAPAAANTIAKFAHGIADNLMSTVFLALPTDIPKLIFPALNTCMLESPATKKNIGTIADRSDCTVYDTEEKRLACGDVGKGALLHPRKIVEIINEKSKC